MITQDKTMKDVVAELRKESVGALLELFELDVALGETTLGARRLSAAMREIAEEAMQLANEPALATKGRLQSLAEYAHNVSSTAEAQAAGLAELEAGLAGWSLSP